MTCTSQNTLLDRGTSKCLVAVLLLCSAPDHGELSPLLLFYYAVWITGLHAIQIPNDDVRQAGTDCLSQLLKLLAIMNSAELPMSQQVFVKSCFLKSHTAANFRASNKLSDLLLQRHAVPRMHVVTSGV